MKWLFRTLGVFLVLGSTGAWADEFATVSPQSLSLTLAAGESTVKTVSITVHPFCLRPYDIDVVAAGPPDAMAVNLSGVQMNGCGGDTTKFDVEITGTGAAQRFALQFVDTEFGGVLASIPVSINIVAPALEPLMGVLTMRRALLFQVASTGCTSKDDFLVEVLESNPLQIRLIRHTPDPCDAVVPLGTLIRFSYRELGIRSEDSLRVVNPLATVTVP